MAISGVVDADIATIANDLGVSRSRVANDLGFTYQAKTATGADSGSKLLTITYANTVGMIRVEWGDGAVSMKKGGASGTITHTYATTGAKKWLFTALGYQKTASTTLAP